MEENSVGNNDLIHEKGKNKGKNKVIIIILIVLACVLLLGAVVFMFLYAQKNSDEEGVVVKSENLLIYKDDNYSYLNIDDCEVINLTQNLDIPEEVISNSDYPSPVITMDGTKIFYLDNEYTNLYCRNLREKDVEKAIVKIDNGVGKFMVDDSGEYVVYLKSDGSGLFINNLEEKNKISNDVSGFYINNDVSKIIYVKLDGEIHLYSDKENDSILDRNSEIKYVAEDFSFIVYLKESTLYKYYLTGEKEKIAQDVVFVDKVFENGNCFYVCYEELNMLCKDYIDVAYSDRENDIGSLMTELKPFNINDYLTMGYTHDEISEEYSSDAYDELWRRYMTSDTLEELEYYGDLYREYDEYEFEEVARKTCLSYKLGETIFEYTKSNLYFYNGIDSKLIAEDYCDTLYASEGIYSYSNYTIEELPRKMIMDVSEIGIEDTYDKEIEDIADEIKSYLEYEIIGDKHTYISVNEKSLEVEGLVSELQVSNDDTECYYLLSDDEDYNNNTLYKISIDETQKIIKSVKVYDNVAMYGFYGKSNKLYTLRDEPEDRSVADLYCEDKCIGYSVNIYSFDNNSFVPGKDECYILADYDDNSHTGVLYKWNGEAVSKIYDDANGQICVYENEAFFIGDCSGQSGYGTVYRVKNETVEAVDQDNVENISLLSTTRQKNLEMLDYNYYIDIDDDEDYDWSDDVSYDY